MQYKAVLLKPLNGYKKGKKLTVTRDRDKRWVSIKGMVIPDKSYIDLKKQIYDNTCRYDKATAEAYVNSNKFSSKTEWLFWCNKWGQRAYVFKGKKGEWKLVKVMKCGTGNIKYGDGSDQGVGFKWRVYDKAKQFQGPTCMQYWNMHYTSPHGNSIHRGPVGNPSTRGCIALGAKGSKWAYNNLPIGTRVVVF